MSCYSDFQFYAGEIKTLSIQINALNATNGCKEPCDLTGLVTTDIKVRLPTSTGELVFDLSSGVVIDSPVLGKIHVDLSAINTDEMVSGTIIVEIMKAGKLVFALAAGRLRKQEIPDC